MRTLLGILCLLGGLGLGWLLLYLYARLWDNLHDPIDPADFKWETTLGKGGILTVNGWQVCDLPPWEGTIRMRINERGLIEIDLDSLREALERGEP